MHHRHVWGRDTEYRLLCCMDGKHPVNGLLCWPASAEPKQDSYVQPLCAVILYCCLDICTRSISELLNCRSQICLRLSHPLVSCIVTCGHDMWIQGASWDRLLNAAGFPERYVSLSLSSSCLVETLSTGALKPYQEPRSKCHWCLGLLGLVRPHFHCRVKKKGGKNI